jgi:hypothetical protein
MTLDQFRVAVSQALKARFGVRLGKMTVVNDVIHVRPRWLLFAWIDGRAPKTSFPFASGGGDDEDRQFQEFMRRVIFTLSRPAER